MIWGSQKASILYICAAKKDFRTIHQGWSKLCFDTFGALKSSIISILRDPKSIKELNYKHSVGSEKR